VFLDALNLARAGNGYGAVEKLQECGVEFAENGHYDEGFEGTTIYSKNEEVDRYNYLRLSKLQTPGWRLKNRVFGTDEVLNHPPSDWGGKKRSLIPETLDMKIGARVMLLVNTTRGPNEFGGSSFEYVNGDCGIIQEFIQPDGGMSAARFIVEIERREGNRNVVVTQTLRPLLWKHPPEKYKDVPKKEWPRWTELDGPLEELLPRWREGKFEPLYVTKKERWLHGAAWWWPMRLAYAATVHKTQGQTLEKVQLDPRGHFWSNPASVYVALSRCRHPEGLRVVGRPEGLAVKCRMDERIREWI
jgi:hypothetical protein